MSRRPKIANQPQKTPLTPEAQDIKQAIQQTHLYPIEQVVYLTDTSHVQHVQGTNRYTIPFPETWRTLTNTELYIGVRSIGLHRQLDHEVLFTLWVNVKRGEASYPSEIGQSFNIKYHETLDFINLPNTLDGLLELLVKTVKNTPGWENEVWDTYKWFHTYDSSHNQHILSLHIVNSEGEITDIVQDNALECHWDFEVNDPNIGMTFKIVPLYNKQGVKASTRLDIYFTGPYASHEQYLLSASFVNQTRWNYLGFTNTVFNPPKVYKINSNDTHYWIELASPDGTEERELPVDGKDFITLEIQLIAQPISHRL